MATIFVTGGNGFIGSVVVRYSSGARIRRSLFTARAQRYRPHRRPDVIKPRSATCATWPPLSRGCRDVDGVIHLAGLSNWGDINSPLMDEVVVTGSRHVLAAAQRAGNVRMVFVSTAAAVNGSTSAVVFNEDSDCTLDLNKFHYSRAKRRVEAACRTAAEAGLPVSIVNPTEVYGPNDTALNTAGNLGRLREE